MKISDISPVATFIILAGLFIIQPWFSRKNVLFGIVFPDEAIGKDRRAKHIILHYIQGSCLSALIIFSIWMYAPDMPGLRLSAAARFNWTMLALLSIETLFFILANRRMRNLKKEFELDKRLTDKIIIETKQSAHETLLPLGWLFALLPMPLVTLAVAIYGYPYMEKRIPVHFGLTGPDAWTGKSFPAVLSPLITEIILILIILFTRRAPASLKGNPQAVPSYNLYRKWLGGLLILVALITEIFFLLIEFSFITPHPAVVNVLINWGIPILIVLFSILMIGMFFLFYRLVRNKHVSGPIFDNDSHWIWGMLYFNSSDPSLFVEKRVGIGFTINMARPAAWLIIIAILAILLISSRLTH